MRCAIHGLSTSRFTRRMSTCRARAARVSCVQACASAAPGASPRGRLAVEGSRGQLVAVAHAAQRLGLVLLRRLCATRQRRHCAAEQPGMQQRVPAARSGARTLSFSSEGYFGSVCFLGGPSAIALRLNGCRLAACCAMATHARAASAQGGDGGSQSELCPSQSRALLPALLAAARRTGQEGWRPRMEAGCTSAPPRRRLAQARRDFFAPKGALTRAAGALGGALGVFAGHPLDTLRVRQQQPQAPLGALMPSCFREPQP